MDGEGIIYGTTAYGGENSCNCGVVFKLSKLGSRWVERVLHIFAGGSTDGANPYATVTLGTVTIGRETKSAIFGVTLGGGSDNLGTVFRLIKSKSRYTFRLLHTFAGSDGTGPLGTLTAVKGKLLGTTYGGGTSGFGTVFELAPTGKIWTESVVYSFTGGTDGGNPGSGVVTDSVGNMYGVTGAGGFGQGVAYEATP